MIAEHIARLEGATNTCDKIYEFKDHCNGKIYALNGKDHMLHWKLGYVQEKVDD